MILFFGYQHISNFLAHETLICIREQKTIQQASRTPSCSSRLKKMLDHILLFTQQDAQNSVQIQPLGAGRSALFIRWSLGPFKFDKKYFESPTNTWSY